MTREEAERLIEKMLTAREAMDYALARGAIVVALTAPAAPPPAAPAPSQPKVTACQRCKGRGWWEPASDIGNRIKCGACGGTGRAPTDGGARSPGAGRGEEGRDGR